MTNPNTSGVSAGGLLNPELHPDLILRNPAEIFTMLRRAHDARVLISVYLDRGQNGFVSALLDISKEAIVLDLSPDEWVNERARAAASLICATQLDGVRIQFELPGVSQTSHEGRAALKASLPEEMLRLQRRDTFRLSVPQHSRIDCVIYLPHNDPQQQTGKSLEIKPRVLDVSAEGVALLFPTPEPPLTVGTLFVDSVLVVPEADSVKLTLRVQNIQHVTLPNGTQNLRVGCQMLSPPNRFVTQLQRFMFKIERERRLLEND